MKGWLLLVAAAAIGAGTYYELREEPIEVAPAAAQRPAAPAAPPAGPARPAAPAPRPPAPPPANAGPLPGSHIPLERALGAGFTFVAACETTGEPLSQKIPGEGGTRTLWAAPSDPTLVLEGKVPRDYGAGLRFAYYYFLAPDERSPKRHECIIWICREARDGAAYGIKALPDTEENRRTVTDALAKLGKAPGGDK